MSLDPQQLADYIKTEARGLGFQLVGIADAEGLPGELRRLKSWLEKGYQGKMTWLEREPERRSDVSHSLPQARSVVMLGMNYFQGEIDEEIPPGHGRIARYARGIDYHDLIEERLEQLANKIRGAAHDSGDDSNAEFACRAFVDSSPLLERQYAEKAGLGFIGKNTLLIHPETGSYYFLAALAISWEALPDDPIEGTCGRCTRCLEACPTDAFPEAGVLNATRCISYLTIEMRDEIEDAELQRGLDNWLFGCDVCQDVCPYNKFAVQTNEPAFLGPAFMDLRALVAIRSNREYNRKFAGSPIVRSRRKGLQRTAAHVLANSAENQAAKEISSDIESELRAAADAYRELQSGETENPGLSKSLKDALNRFDEGISN